ncbi:MAG: type II secretion system protein [Lentisphaeraceae bacterium]|nr:type II secretion system protein [Lentisphaeraceae bacterium]
MKQRFTLIELLVVIAIIGILVSMILPSLAKAKKKAQASVCLSQWKQINTAMVVFNNANNGKYTPAATGYISWDDALGDYDGRNLTQAEKRRDFLLKSDTNRHSLYRCPSSKWGDGEDYFFRSYSLNAGYVGNDFRGIAWIGDSRFVSEVEAPSGTLMGVERDQIQWNRVGYRFGGFTNAQQHYMPKWGRPTHPTINLNVHGVSKVTMTTCDGSARLRNPYITPFDSVYGNMWTVDTSD